MSFPSASEDDNRTVRSEENETVRSEETRDESRSLAASLEEKMEEKSDEFDSPRWADVVFVLDCTGSMSKEIETVKSALNEFADEVEERGVPLRIGLVAFRDLFEGEQPQVFDLSEEIPEFQKSLSDLEAWGGGDEPESALDALMTALDQSFAEGHQKVLVLITDAPPHVPDKNTSSFDVVRDRMQEVGLNQLYMVLPTGKESCNVYNDLLKPDHWSGLIFDLGRGEDFEEQAEHFKETLLNLGESIATSTLSAGSSTLGKGLR